MRHTKTSARAVASTIAWALAVLTLWACAPSTQADDESETTMPHTLPGAEPYPAELQRRLRAAVAEKGESYEPRTHHLTDDGSAVYTNRLIFEDSPYLVQHAHNPVDWYPWGEEAFEKAKREQKPIFLSIGYSTCHWCHVMERESFESAEIARIMNERFVCIKIDRERRPDIDDIYMTAVHLQGGRGGWPMSSFLTPEGKPFFGATYFPPQQFTALLRQVDETWHANRAQLVDSANRIAEAVAEAVAARGEARELAEGAFDQAVSQILRRHEPRRGGFGSAPKFPQEPWLLFLLDRIRRGDENPLTAVVKSLDEMARGGIYDQVGGGFHRYSVDDEWLVPHFEKMLYNQAHLSRAYLAAYELTGERFFARVARQTLDYVAREMIAPGGGFYSATDADSEGEEGLFFLWTTDELQEVLGKDDAALTIELYGASRAGNFEGQNILHLPVGLAEYAATKGMKLAVLLERVDAIREMLWQEREKREHPIRDDKVLTSWNGMMITAFAAGADVLDEPGYLDAARAAAEFLWKHNRRAEGELWRVHLDGSSSIPAVQDDYAYFAEALLALYDQSGEAVWLERAGEVVDGMITSFWDGKVGGFFMSAEGIDSHLIARPKSPNDGAIPSGNSVAVVALAQLAARTGEVRYREHTEKSLRAFGQLLERHAAGFGYMLMGAADLLHGGAGRRQYSSAGTVRATARLAPAEDDELNLQVELRMRDGWHVNAHETLQEELIATELLVDTKQGGWELAETVYPEGERVKLGFQEEPLLVYEDEVTLSGRLRRNAEPASGSAGLVHLKLRVQACNDEKCLRPEWVLLEVATGAVTGES